MVDRENDATSIVTVPTRHWTRPVILGTLWLIGLLATLNALGVAYVTYATNDYRPILTRGVWSCGAALLAFLAATLLVRRWKARIPGIVASLLVVAVLAQLLARLAAIERSVS
jgi:hypothetical protein